MASLYKAVVAEVRMTEKVLVVGLDEWYPGHETVNEVTATVASMVVFRTMTDLEDIGDIYEPLWIIDNGMSSGCSRSNQITDELQGSRVVPASTCFFLS